MDVEVKKISAALFNNVSVGILIVNHLGKISHVNQFLLKQFGYIGNELIGEKIDVLIPERFKQDHEKHHENYVTSSHSRPMGLGIDLFGFKKDGTEFPVEVSLSTYAFKDKSYTIAFVNDITIRKRSEKELIKLNAELEQKVRVRTQSLRETVTQLRKQIIEAQEKDIRLQGALEKEKELNELKSRFVSLASHEFRTPLSTVLSSVHLIQQYNTTADQSKREKHTQRIESSVNMLIDILNDFLSVGKIDERKTQVHYQAFSISELIDSVIEEMELLLKKSQSFNYFHSGETEVHLDPALIKHIIINLLSNAIKFSPENSVIKVSSAGDGTQLVLSVKDNGIGISQEDQGHLFERFFRGTNVSNIQGTGLGLHIVREYALLMNGSIACKSESDMGTEFIVTLKQMQQ